MIAKYLWQLGSLIFVVLGSIHLYYTFFTNRFLSKNVAVVDAMKSSSPILTKETTMWQAWIGFNASHSSGAIFIGMVNFYVTCFYFAEFESDHFLPIFSIVTVGFYVWLAKKYWFRIPFMGIVFTLLCYVLAYVWILAN